MSTSSQSPLLDEERRTALRSAFEVADHLTELAPVPPTDAKVQTDCSQGWTTLGVVLHFDGSESVAKFAGVLGVTPGSDTFEFGGSWYTEASASGVLANVPFRAWNWTRVETPQVVSLSKSPMAVAR